MVILLRDESSLLSKISFVSPAVIVHVNDTIHRIQIICTKMLRQHYLTSKDIVLKLKTAVLGFEYSLIHRTIKIISCHEICGYLLWTLFHYYMKFTENVLYRQKGGEQYSGLFHLRHSKQLYYNHRTCVNSQGLAMSTAPVQRPMVKSYIWETFCVITVYDNNITSGFAACKQCHKVLQFV